MRREWNKQKIYQNKKENKMQNATQTNNARLELIKASEIEPKKIEWLWYPFIPYGKVTLLQGDPGDGEKHLYADNRRPAHKGRAVAIYGNGESRLRRSASSIRPRRTMRTIPLSPASSRRTGTENACCSSAKRKAH